jgi:RNA polymerase sigma-70 factor (ECF subfamily)
MLPFTRKRKLCTAFSALRPELYRIAWSWCHDDALAEDLVQDTCLRALEKSFQLEAFDKLRPWLLRIMANLHSDHFRRMRETVELDDCTPALRSADPCPAEAAERHATVIMVHSAIASLGDDQRKVLTLVDVGGFSYAEVDEALEIPIGTVMSRLSRARKQLRRHLAPRQVDNPRLRSVK